MGNRNTTEWKELLSVCSNFSNAIILFFKSPSYSDVFCFHCPFMLILKYNEYRGMSLSVCRSPSLITSLSHSPDYLRSDDQLEVQDISDSEASSSAVLPSFSRIQSRLNPVPESLNSPDIAPGEKNCQGGRIDGDN